MRAKPLDPLETRVLAYIAAGDTDSHIAARIGKSVGSVRWTARSAIAKLGAMNRPHAVAKALALGYLRVEDPAAEWITFASEVG